MMDLKTLIVRIYCGTFANLIVFVFLVVMADGTALMSLVKTFEMCFFWVKTPISVYAYMYLYMYVYVANQTTYRCCI